MLFDKTKQKYEFYSGKGGVGKTTLSAARALRLSEEDKRVLIVSTDPAHSLSDSFSVEIGPEIKQIKENLYGVEINPEKALKDYKEKIKTGEMGGLEEFGMGDFNLTGVSPGMDEFAAFDKFLQYMNKEEYDYIIFDTAPTGHTLRFFSLPEIMEGWIGKIIKLKIKFSQISNLFKKFMPFSEEKEEDKSMKALERMKERIKKARKVMTNPNKTKFNLVLTPEKMGIEETKRTIETLKKENIQINEIIINKLIPKTSNCDFCKARRKMQEKNLKEIEERFKNYKLKRIPLKKEEVVGFNRLEKFLKKKNPN